MGGNSDILILPSFIVLVISKTYVLKRIKEKKRRESKRKLRGILLSHCTYSLGCLY